MAHNTPYTMQNGYTQNRPTTQPHTIVLVVPTPTVAGALAGLAGGNVTVHPTRHAVPGTGGALTAILLPGFMATPTPTLLNHVCGLAAVAGFAPPVATYHTYA
jgi:hypothetical protein